MNAEILNKIDEEFMECPDCQAKIPVNFANITWCECGHNLKPKKSDKKMKSKIEKLYDDLVQNQFGQSLIPIMRKFMRLL